MKKSHFILIIALILFAGGCSVPGRFLVTELGYEPEETRESYIYALPKTSLKVTVHYKSEVFIPGPYADYAQKMLGIEGVKKERDAEYTLTEVELSNSTEPDANHFYALNTLVGDVDLEMLKWAEDSKLILRGDYASALEIEVQHGDHNTGSIMYTDVTMESNVEMREQTIYKTIITDTSFVRVPVTTEQMEMKTIERKAEEAARLILEIRSDRYYVAAGLIDPFPDNFDMATSLRGLDKLENEYLSLFIGKTYTEEYSREYIVIPEGDLDRESFMLGRFSKEQGLSESLGLPVTLIIEPAGNAASFRNLLPQNPEEQKYNCFYYRIPEVCNIEIVNGDKTILKKRMSIFQSGALVNQKVKMEPVSKKDL